MVNSAPILTWFKILLMQPSVMHAFWDALYHTSEAPNQHKCLRLLGMQLSKNKLVLNAIVLNFAAV